MEEKWRSTAAAGLVRAASQQSELHQACFSASEIRPVSFLFSRVLLIYDLAQRSGALPLVYHVA